MQGEGTYYFNSGEYQIDNYSNDEPIGKHITVYNIVKGLFS